MKRAVWDDVTSMCVYIYLHIYIYQYTYIHVYVFLMYFICICLHNKGVVQFASIPGASRSGYQDCEVRFKKRESSEKPITVGGAQALATPPKKGRPYKPYSPVHIYIYHLPNI